MKKSKLLEELNSKDDKALYKELSDLNVKMNELYFKNTFKNLKNFHEITDNRKKIARIWTILNQRINEKILKEMAK